MSLPDFSSYAHTASQALFQSLKAVFLSLSEQVAHSLFPFPPAYKLPPLDHPKQTRPSSPALVVVAAATGSKTCVKPSVKSRTRT